MTDRQARMMRNLLFLVAALLGACVALLCRRCRYADGGVPHAVDTTEVRRDTFIIHDTVVVPAPLPLETRAVGDTAVRVPAHAVAAPSVPDSACVADDSVAVTLPVVSRHYGDSLYDAWVSGPVDPRLDSLRVYPRHITVVETVRIRDPPRRWGISVGAGIVATPARVEPGVFVGISYTFISF